MARIRGRNTKPEQIIEKELQHHGVTGYERHCKDLSGTPDFVFRKEKLVVFVDGDFWHGYRFSLWAHKLSPAWRDKIAATRERDRRNFGLLRRAGWKVMRIWEHQIERHPAEYVVNIRNFVRDRQKQFTENAPTHER